MAHHPGHTAAFAEGRRLREASRMRRREEQWQLRQERWQRHSQRRAQMYAQRSRRHPGWAPPNRRPGMSPWWFLLVIPVVGGGSTALVMAIVGLVVLGAMATAVVLPVLVAGTVAFVAARHHRRARLRRGGAAGTAPLPARPAAPPRPDLVWARARERFHALRASYAAYECDAMAVLRLPALADVTVPSTGRFVDAFAEAQALETDALPPPQHAVSFVAAVDKAERSWHAAREAAERIRLSGLSPAERGTVERVIKLLTTARDSDSDHERAAAYARARSELAKLERAGVLQVPRPAQAALDAAAQSALPAR